MSILGADRGIIRKHAAYFSTDIKAAAVVGLGFIGNCIEFVINAYGHFGISNFYDGFITKLDIRTCVGRLSAAVGLFTVNLDGELNDQLFAVSAISFYIIRYKVRAVVKAGHGDVLAGDIYSYTAGDVSPSFTVSKFIAIIVRCVDLNISICRCSEVRRDLVGEHSSAVEAAAGLAYGRADVIKRALQLICIIRLLVVALIAASAICTQVRRIGIVRRNEVHITVGFAIHVADIGATKNAYGVDKRAVIILEAIRISYCGICYSIVKTIIMIRLTVSEHYNHALAVGIGSFRAKSLFSFFKTPVGCRCTGRTERINSVLKACFIIFY